MLTFLTSAKSFDDENRQKQIRAIQSWLAIDPNVEVFVYGQADGAHQVCLELGAIYVPNVDCTDSGLPYFNSIVEHAREHASFDIQVYLNCDILLNFSLAQAIRQIPFPQYLLIGQRIDLGEGVVVDPSSPDWLESLRVLAGQNQATLHPVTGKDYFVFQRGMWAGLPRIVIGRGGYDSALLAHCLHRRIPIVDGTFSVLALHQFHNYAHTAGGIDEVMRGGDARRNRRNSGVLHSAPTIGDAQWVLRDNRLLPSACRGDRLRAREMYYRFEKRQEALGLAVRALWRILTQVGLYSPRVYTLPEILNMRSST